MAFLPNLKGYVAFITGGSRGIGRQIAIDLAKEGADICVVARNKEALENVVEECKAQGVRAMFVTADSKDLDSLKSAVDQCIETLGSLSILVNNAGIFAAYAEGLEKWIDCINVNLISLMGLTHYALPHLTANPRSAIIQISSIAGKYALPHCAPYCASKWGVLGFSQCLFQEVREKGVKVCTICPGLVKTDMAMPFVTEYEKMIQPEDISATVVFVAKFPSTGCPTEIEIMPQQNPGRAGQLN